MSGWLVSVSTANECELRPCISSLWPQQEVLAGVVLWGIAPLQVSGLECLRVIVQRLFLESRGRSGLKFSSRSDGSSFTDSVSDCNESTNRQMKAVLVLIQNLNLMF